MASERHIRMSMWFCDPLPPLRHLGRAGPPCVAFFGAHCFGHSKKVKNTGQPIRTPIRFVPVLYVVGYGAILLCAVWPVARTILAYTVKFVCLNN